MSDHAFIAVTVGLQFQHGQLTNSFLRRRWRDFDYNKFCDDLSSSAFLCDPPRYAVGLFACYHDILQALVDKHAPFAVNKLRAHPTAPWYDLNCHLECIYRRDKSDENVTPGADSQESCVLPSTRSALIIGLTPSSPILATRMLCVQKLIRF
jgi:hypothetical protein